MDRRARLEAEDEVGVVVRGIDAAGHAVLANGDAAGEAAAADPHPLIFLVAGEPSGDLLGARLMAALKKRTKDRISFAGIGGARMEEQGMKSQFPMTELSVMGAAEVLPRIPRILTRIVETAAAAQRLRPAAVVTIDSPDFNFRVTKRLKGEGIPLIH